MHLYGNSGILKTLYVNFQQHEETNILCCSRLSGTDGSVTIELFAKICKGRAFLELNLSSKQSGSESFDSKAAELFEIS